MTVRKKRPVAHQQEQATDGWWRSEVDESHWPIFEDFRNFLYMVWKHLLLPDPTPVQYDIASYLQHGPRRMIVEAFRGVGKSWITSAFVCWLLMRDPQLNILVVSASKGRSDDFSTFTLRLINEIPILEFLKPQEGQRFSKIAFDVGPAKASHAPSVKSVGISGQLTGGRADVIIADDVEVPNNSLTQALRDKLAESVKEFDAILKPTEAARIIYLGTPQTELSIYNVLPDRGYEIRVWPARYPDEKRRNAYGNRLAPSISDALDRNQSLVGHSTDPRRFDDEELLEREASYGRSGFALQFMLDTTLSDMDRYPLKLADLVVMTLNSENGPEKVIWAASMELAQPDLPNVGFTGDRYYKPMQVQGQWIPYQGSCMFIDPSGRGKDETAYAVVKMLNGQLFLLEAGGLPGGYDEATLKALAVIAARQKVNIILIESNFGDGMFTQLFKPVLAKVHPVTIEEVRHNTQKELRIIDTLEPVLNQHKLVVDAKLVMQDFKSTAHLPTEQAISYQLFYQLTRITKDRGSLGHDDRLDALAGAVAYWTERMGRDVDAAIAEREEEWRRAEIERFMEHVIGHKPAPQTWV